MTCSARLAFAFPLLSRATLAAIFIVLCVCSSGMAVEPQAKLDVNSPVYKKASAYAPDYTDKNLWPHDVEKTDYFNEKWEPARLLIWAHAGKSIRGLDPSDPDNWLENGKRAAKGPDENTDVVFGAGSVVLNVTGGAVRFRHVTVEGGSRVGLRDVDIYGNLWIKEGASFSRAAGIFGKRDKSTFCRSDNDSIQFITNMIIHNKKKGASTEWIGKWKVGDEVNLYSGTMIVAPDSTFLPTDRRTQRIYPDAELILMSGSTFHTRGNLYGEPDIEVKGKLLAGSTTRPLTRDCTLGLSFKAKGQGGGIRQTKQSHAHDPGGLVLHKEGAMIVNSADPKTARLVFKWHRRENESFPLDNGEPKDLAAMPHGIDMVLLGNTPFNGVEFNDVLKGGIHLSDQTMRARWQAVTFATGNFGKPDELFSGISGLKLDESPWGKGRQNP